MLKYTKSQTLNGSSVIKVDDGERIVATMNGTLNNDGTIGFNYYISDRPLYKEHKAEVQADIIEFQDILNDLVE